MKTDKELLRELFDASKNLIEETCYMVDKDETHAECKLCGAITGVGALYNHEPSCKIYKIYYLFDQISPRISKY